MPVAERITRRELLSTKNGKEGHNKIASQSDRSFAECNVQGGIGERPQDPGARLRQNANALHSNLAGRYGRR